MNSITRRILIEIPGEPVAKGRPRFGRLANGAPTTYTPAKTEKYENLIKIAAQNAMKGAIPLDQPLRVVVTAYMAMPQGFSRKKRYQGEYGDLKPTKRPDADNFLKAALDGMNGIIYRDDALVTDATIGKRYSEHPRMVIEVFA